MDRAWSNSTLAVALPELRGAVGQDLVGVIDAAQPDLGVLGFVVEMFPDDAAESPAMAAQAMTNVRAHA